jgi:hypothetical protein
MTLVDDPGPCKIKEVSKWMGEHSTIHFGAVMGLVSKQFLVLELAVELSGCLISVLG